MAYAEAKHIAVEAIPVISIVDLAAREGAATRRVGEALRQACEYPGFFYVKDHGIPEPVLEGVFAVSRRFFRRPAEAKAAVAISPDHRGWLKPGEATMRGNRRPDLKESFVWGREVAPGETLGPGAMAGPNRWPADMPELKPALMAWFDAGHAVAWRLLAAFATALDVSPDYFRKRIGKPISRASIVYYPPQPAELGDEQFGVGPHTDYGVLTLVYQDQTGGLEVKGRDGQWLTAHPIPGTLVVNVGDLLGRWTNDRFVSTPHRVVNRSGRERFSTAIFVDPDADTEIVPVARPGEAAKYAPVTCGAYIRGRLDESMAYRKAKA
jgi:isopenicillin N synthase-like dioxygenase